MILNQNIIDNFKKLIKLIEIETNYLDDKKEILINRYRISNLKKSLKIISNFDKEILKGEDLIDIKGIGKGTVDRINEILETGKLKDLKNYDKIIKKSSTKEAIIDDLMRIIGIGRVQALHLISEYNIKSAIELKELSDSGQIELNDKIKIGLKYLGKFEGLIPRSEIDVIYDYLQLATDKYNKSFFITICGSYRRESPYSSDIDILLCSLDMITMDDIMSNNILEEYVNYLHEIDFLIDDITDKNIITKYMGFGRSIGKSIGKSKGNKSISKIRRVDIRLIPMNSYFPALLYFTGSYEFNQEMRSNAKKLGYKLNEYGLYDKKTGEDIPILSEQDMFKVLNMKYLAPSER